MTAKPASSTFPKFDMPKFELPKFDTQAVMALHKANLETFVAAQKIWFDLAQTMAKKQTEMFKETMAKFDVVMKGGYDAKKQPQAYVEEVKAAMEKAMADVKETVDLGMKAQSEVVDLFVKRATANFDEVKALAA